MEVGSSSQKSEEDKAYNDRVERAGKQERRLEEVEAVRETEEEPIEPHPFEKTTFETVNEHTEPVSSTLGEEGTPPDRTDSDPDGRQKEMHKGNNDKLEDEMDRMRVIFLYSLVCLFPVHQLFFSRLMHVVRMPLGYVRRHCSSFSM